MANQLLDAIEAAARSKQPLCWLDAEDYGSRIVLNGKPLPWNKPTEFVSAFGQIHNLLKPGVAPIHLGRFLAAWLAANPGALEDMRGKQRMRFALRKLLGMAQHRQLIHEIVSALGQTLAQPLVLVLPPNGELINWANGLANGAAAAEISDIDVDSVSVYLADFLRTFSGLNVAGVLVQLPPGTWVTLDLLELYSPIINVARHYHWAMGMQLSGEAGVDDPGEVLQYVIAERAVGRVSGVVQTDAFWQGEAAASPVDGFVYAEVPEALEPEQVLDRLASLRQRVGKAMRGGS